MNPLVEHSVPGLHAALAEVIRDLPFINSKSKILDLGAGSGAFLARLNELGYSHLAGVDLNPINLSHLNIADYQMDLNHPNEDGIPPAICLDKPDATYYFVHEKYFQFRIDILSERI